MTRKYKRISYEYRKKIGIDRTSLYRDLARRDEEPGRQSGTAQIRQKNI